MSSDQFAATSFLDASEDPTTIELVASDALEALRERLDARQRASLDRQGFEAERGQFAWLEDDGAARVLAGWDGKDDLGALGALPTKLPEGDSMMLLSNRGENKA